MQARTQGHADRGMLSFFFFCYTHSKHGLSINLQICVSYKHKHTHTHIDVHRQIHSNALWGVSMVKKIFNDILKAQIVPLRLFIVSIRPSIPTALQM